jgi:benzoate membrane transport protein
MTTNAQPDLRWRDNLRDLPRAMNLSAFFSGFLVRLVGYTGPLVLVLQTTQAGNLSPAETASWIWGVGVANGLASIILSLLFRMPIMSAWSTAGAALLATAFSQYNLSEVIGANILTALLIIALGLSGLFGRLIALIPRAVVLGMLAGILLQFGLNMFRQLNDQPLLILAAIAAYMLLRRLRFSVPILGALLVGLLIAFFQGLLHFEAVNFALTEPLLLLPSFRLDAAINLALPLALLALTSQYAPGQAVLQASGYEPPINGILSITGLMTLLFAPTGGHGVTLGALTSAMITNPDAQADPDLRYAAGVSAGLWSVIFGLFGVTVVGLFAGFPQALIAVLAGLGLGATISSSLAEGFSKPASRDGALMAFLCAASGISLLGISAPFWALLIGVAVQWLSTPKPS